MISTRYVVTYLFPTVTLRNVGSARTEGPVTCLIQQYEEGRALGAPSRDTVARSGLGPGEEITSELQVPVSAAGEPRRGRFEYSCSLPDESPGAEQLGNQAQVDYVY